MAEINTTVPLDVDTISWCAQREVDMATGTLLLGPPLADPQYPSVMAQGLLLRFATLAEMPGVFSDPECPQALAFMEAGTLLSIYIRRLEDVARLHGTCQPK